MIELKRLFLRQTTENGEAPLRLDLPDRAYVVSVRRSERARRLTLRVASATGDISLTAPLGVQRSTLSAFLYRHIDWLETQIELLPQRLRFCDGAMVPLRGIDHVMRASWRTRGLVTLNVEENGQAVLVVPGAPAHIERRLVDFFKAQAALDLEHAVRIYSARIGRKARRIVIRDTASRWGSCASNGDLSFSWRLVMAPGFVLDYVAAHEVAHLAHMNHGPRFWRLLHEICPPYAQAKAWMSTHGRRLHAYGPPPGRKAAPLSLAAE